MSKASNPEPKKPVGSFCASLYPRCITLNSRTSDLLLFSVPSYVAGRRGFLVRDNPSWISPLASLMRASLNGLLKEVATKDEVGGQRWKANQVLQVGQLPLDMCLLMLKASGLELSNATAKDEDIVRTSFDVHFGVTRGTPLPTRSDLRYQSTMVKLAKVRIEHLDPGSG